MSNRKTGLEKGTILDDFGNVVKLPDGAIEQDPKTGAIKDYRVIKDRVRERNAGCWSCIHYETGVAFDAAVAQAHRRDIMALQTDHMGPDGTMRKAVDQKAAKGIANYTRMLLTRSPGIFGICTGNGVGLDADGNEVPVGEFIPKSYLCRKWSGRTGASLARAPGEALSPLIAEEYDKIGESPRFYNKKDDDK